MICHVTSTQYLHKCSLHNSSRTLGKSHFYQCASTIHIDSIRENGIFSSQIIEMNSSHRNTQSLRQSILSIHGLKREINRAWMTCRTAVLSL